MLKAKPTAVASTRARLATGSPLARRGRSQRDCGRSPRVDAARPYAVSQTATDLREPSRGFPSSEGTARGAVPSDEKEHHISEPRINDRIRVPEVRLVGPNGEQVGIVRVEDALRWPPRPNSTWSRSPDGQASGGQAHGLRQVQI